MVGFCEDCSEPLCHKCHEAHLRLTITKHHLITIFADPLPSVVAGDPEVPEDLPLPPGPKKPPMLPVVERALVNDIKCRQFTGIPLYLFNLYMTGLEGQFLKRSKLSPHDQLALLFNMMKTNQSNINLGIVFGANERTIATILKHVTRIAFNFARRFLYWFSREEVDGSMFKTFKDSFPKTRCIIDGTEVKTQMPKSISEAVLMWSQYKHAYTWKELVAIGKNLSQFVNWTRTFML